MKTVTQFIWSNQGQGKEVQDDNFIDFDNKTRRDRRNLWKRTSYNDYVF